jgi:hypothetical protein
MHHYRALKLISTLCKASGVVCLIGALIPFLILLLFHPNLGTSVGIGIITFLGWSAGLLMAGLFNYGFGELICLFIDIESNTRAARPGGSLLVD